MPVGGSSGTYSWAIPLSDVLIECFERCGVHLPALTTAQIASGTRSLNLVLTRWSNRGVNLWKIDQVSTFLSQGVATYDVDQNVVGMYGTVLRQYQLGAAFSITPAVSTTATSTTVTIAGLTQTPVSGGFISISVPISVGGIVVQGFYQVASVPTSGSCTFVAADAATSTVVSGGSVPSYSTSLSSTSITGVLANHGLVVGDSWMVHVSTSVGGLTLLGTYTVATVADANTFTFTSEYAAGSADTASENDGDAQVSVQAVSQVNPIDLVLYQLSRDDYSAVPNKQQQGRPNSIWFDRQIRPQFTLWNVPDGSGPYEVVYYAFRQIEDAYPRMAQTPDMPSRFFEAYCAGVAAHLAMKWAPERAKALLEYAKECWMEASDEDRERVPLRIQPDISQYFGR